MSSIDRRWPPPLLAAIAIGGVLGATARWALAEALPVATGRFPWATFIANLAGSALLGATLSLTLHVERLRRGARLGLFGPFMATGVLGSFTTMSAFTVETALLLKVGDVLIALLYTASSVAGGLVLAWLALASADRLLSERAPG